MYKRQTNLFEFLGDLEAAMEQEMHKQVTEEYQNVSAEGREPTLKDITADAYRNAVRTNDADTAIRYWQILKDMHVSNYGDL